MAKKTVKKSKLLKKVTLSGRDKSTLRRIMKKVRQIRLYDLQQARRKKS